jgi:plasmid stabilization system protein ParE
MRVRYDDEAREDLLGAVRWYEQHRAGLGVRFHASVRTAERQITEAPGLNPEVDRVGETAIRRAFVRGFPYAVLYMEHGGEVWVLAVMHLHREPGYRKSRAPRVG